MSPKRNENTARVLHKNAPVFAALGDTTRLTLLVKLGDGVPHSISELTEGSAMSRQAVTKHLRVLEDACLVTGVKQGRESLFALQKETVHDARNALDAIALQWDNALARLKSFVEKDDGLD